MEYKKDLQIDIHNLDEECIKQPVLFDQYAQDLTPLYKSREELKVTLETTNAKLDGIIREAASAEGKKLTEGKIEAEIKINPEYINIQMNYLKICNEIKEKEVIKEAFQQKRDMLKLLVELFIAGYYSQVEPKILKYQRNETLKEKLINKIKEEKNEE